jgi:protocatechuate 3,4-dioxygenase beta subunit
MPLMLRAERRWIGVAVLALGAAAVAQAPRQVTISGRVVDENGKPVAGASAGVFAADEFVDTAQLLADPAARSGADGRYAVAVGAEGCLLVLAAPGRQSCAQQIRDRRHDTAVGDTVLMPGSRLAGRVRDEAGAPLAGARLRVESSVFGTFELGYVHAGAVSGADGVFVVPGVPRTGLRLIAEADGCSSEAKLVGPETSADFTLAKLGVVRGRVVDDTGAPVAGVLLSCVTVETCTVVPHATSRADGAFAITVPVRGPFRIVGSERRVPFRVFSSGPLHGPGDGAVVTNDPTTRTRMLEVTAVDAATRAPIPEFSLAEVLDPIDLPLTVRLHCVACLHPCKGSARVPVTGQVHGVMVEAPDHGFEVTPIPNDDAPLVIALGPEAVLRGRVVDAATGKAMAGVAVCALPKGEARGLLPDSLMDACPRTDANGDYCIRGLRPGEYGVQAHAEDRPASPVAWTELAAGDANRLNLAVPKQRWIEFEFTGAVAPGPAPQLGIRPGNFDYPQSSFEHALALPAGVAITGPGRYRLGPLGSGTWRAQLLMPSRTRVGMGRAVDLGMFDPDAGPKTIELPAPLRQLRGRVELPRGVPAERIGVLARRAQPPPDRSRPDFVEPVAGVDADGSFALEVPAGTVCLQLADLATDIVFHTEGHDLEVGADTPAVTIRPSCHWLTVDCTPPRAGDVVALHAFNVMLPPQRDGAYPSTMVDLHGRYGAHRHDEYVEVPFAPGNGTQRWLVPAGPIEVNPWRSIDVLRPGPTIWGHVVIGSANLTVDQAEHRIALSIPSLPPDEEILKRH